MKALKKRLRAINESRAQKRKVFVTSVLFGVFILVLVPVKYMALLISLHHVKLFKNDALFSIGWPSLRSSSFWIAINKVWSLPGAKAM
jgi:hypothetical protein